MKTTTYIKLALSTVILSASAHAATINGSINVSAMGSPTIDYNLNEVSFGPSPNSFVTSAVGDYSPSVSFLDLVNYTDFQYDPFAGPISPLWETVSGAASFSLTAITFIDENPGSGLLLKGYGVASLAGFDDTVGSWSFGATQNGSNFSWTSINSAPSKSNGSVPDGGSTLAILGLSILGLGGARRIIFRSKS